MHGKNSVEPTRIELIREDCAEVILAFGGGAEPDDTECRAAALPTADGDASHRADHVLEPRNVRPRPFGLVREGLAVGRTVQHLEAFGGIKTEIFRPRRMRDVTPRLEEAVDRDALLQMFVI